MTTRSPSTGPPRLVEELLTQVKRLEAENERLRVELDELRETTTGADAEPGANRTTPSAAIRFWQWVTGDDTSSERSTERSL